MPKYILTDEAIDLLPQYVAAWLEWKEDKGGEAYSADGGLLERWLREARGRFIEALDDGGEVEELRLELLRQWKANHTEHCDLAWPHEGECYWVLPSMISQEEAIELLGALPPHEVREVGR